jgi:hypothetical protein
MIVPSSYRFLANRRTGCGLHGRSCTPEVDARLPHADKGYDDSDAIRRQVESAGTMPNIPPKTNRRWKNCFSPMLYRNRNAIERMFCR